MDIYIPEKYIKKTDRRVRLSGNFLRDYGQSKPEDGYDLFYITERTEAEKSSDAWPILRASTETTRS